MNSTVLECFPKLLKENTNERLDGGTKLLHVLKELQENGESKELNHVLNRLVRGLGSSKNSSRKGFYSTFTVYLILNPNMKIDDIFNIMDQELKATASSSKSEVADTNNGRILACGAIIRSKIFKFSSINEQKRVLECLIHSGKQRSYLNLESVSFIIEFLNQLENEDSLIPIWPVLEPEICKPILEHSLDTFYVLLVVQDKFPGIFSKKLMKKYFGSENIINEESIKDILKILTDVPRVICYKHPVYKIFCKKLIATDYFEPFWLGIDQCFIKPSKTVEHLGVELFKLFLETIISKSVIPILLSPNFLLHMLKRVSNNAKYKIDEVARGFKNGLSLLIKVLDKDVKSKVHIAVIKKLILYPGDLMIERITGIKVLQMISSNMKSDGIRKLSNLYKDIATNTKFKEKPNSITELWTNAERSFAAQLISVKLMGHPEIISDHEWRVEQLKFLFNLGLCDVPNVGVELIPHFKESFYRALDHKLPKLNDLKVVLSSLIKHINKSVFQDSELKLRISLDEIAVETWQKMIKLVQNLEKEWENQDKINTVFHVMDLHMSLQLFSDPEMAISSINELHSCYDHLKKKTNSAKKSATITVDNGEPEWIEVVVDLFLSLLSRKSHLLRSLIVCVFPHICPYIEATSIHQILAILDTTNGKNPLSSSKNDEESDSEAEFNDDEEENEEEENIDEESNQTVDDESDSDVEDSDIEDETMTDRLRLAVRQALGDSKMETDDEDVDNINEEEGKRLDESLAAAFKILKENRKSQSKKQEKKAQALTHFRIRVLDLLEIYLEVSPSMALALDMLVPLFTLLEFSIKDPHQKPLENRVRSCLKKLSSVKKFKNVDEVDEDLLTTVLKALIEKGERSASICQEMGDKLAECCVFLVRCSQQTNVPTASFIKIFEENLTAFFKKRDCILPAVLFKKLLQLCWIGNWHLGLLLVNFAFDSSIRSYRRGQALEFLKIFYDNIRMISDNDYKDKRLKMEKNLCTSSVNVFLDLTSSQKTENGKTAITVGKELKQKYIYYLLTLLLTVHIHHIPQAWEWNKIGECMANYRSNITLSKDAKSAYNRLSHRIGAPAITQKEKVLEESRISNGKEDSEMEDNRSTDEKLSTSSQLDKISKNIDKKRKKNSSKTKEKQKLKKEARELREKAMSQGFESFNFSNINISNGISEEPIENGKTEKSDKLKKKRPELNTLDVPYKKKKITV